MQHLISSDSKIVCCILNSMGIIKLIRLKDCCYPAVEQGFLQTQTFICRCFQNLAVLFSSANDPPQINTNIIIVASSPFFFLSKHVKALKLTEMFTVGFFFNFLGSICATTTSGHRAASILLNRIKWAAFFLSCNRLIHTGCL